MAYILTNKEIEELLRQDNVDEQSTVARDIEYQILCNKSLKFNELLDGKDYLLLSKNSNEYRLIRMFTTYLFDISTQTYMTEDDTKDFWIMNL